MKFFNQIHSLLAAVIEIIIKQLFCNHNLIHKLRRSIFFILCFINLPAKEIAIIFKGEAVKFKKSSKPLGNSELHGKFGGKEVLATTKFNTSPHKNRYLGSFRTLKKTHKNQHERKLITYYVFEKP